MEEEEDMEEIEEEIDINSAIESNLAGVKLSLALRAAVQPSNIV